jgi:hypothetical protein
MKNLIIFFLLPLRLCAQDMSGVWSGTLYNDSTQTSTRYELAISERNGKFTAYSYTIFKVDNREIYGVKSLDIIKQKDKVFLKDKELLVDNYPPEAPKGIKQISAIKIFDSLNIKWLTGAFTTTRSGKYGKPVTGRIFLSRVEENQKDIALIKLLVKSNIASTLQFLTAETIEDPVKKTIADKPVAEKPVVKTKEKSIDKIQQKVELPVIKKAMTFEEALAIRSIITIQTIEFNTDSLRLELYDNGTVDGDSVSVIVNGKVVMEHQRLTAKAIQKTVFAEGDSLRIVLFAENLGSIAPNTGLLIVYDGQKRYEISFSGDLTKNSAILFKRRKN